MDERINLGAGHSFSKILDERGLWVGIMEYHTAKRRGHRECVAFIGFRPYYINPGWRKRKGVHNLTLSPSVRCDCGAHGWISKGRWHKAHDKPNTLRWSMRHLFGRGPNPYYGVWWD